MKKFKLFPTPVMEFDFSNHPDLLKILNLINNISLQNLDENHLLNQNGATSYNKIDILSSPETISLKNDFQKSIDYYSNEIQITKNFITQSWFNILNNKGKTTIHHHGPSVISGAFYPLLKENTCNLCFRSPLYSAHTFESNNPTHANHFQPDVIMPIKENHLYLFPSWLQHYTEENKGDKRIVLSFNTKVY